MPTPNHLNDLRSDLEYGFVDHQHPAPLAFNPQLISNVNDDATMLGAIEKALHQCEEFCFSVAFITESALAALKQVLRDFTGRGTIITSRYLDFNKPSMFKELLKLDNVTVKVHDDPARGFHAKGYVFRSQHTTRAIVGSSNLTDTALMRNREWNLEVSASASSDFVRQLDAAIDEQLANSIPLTSDWIERYAATRQPQQVVPLVRQQGKIQPNKMQEEALLSLQNLRDNQASRALVISATGTGKTILSALAARNFQPKRMLFVVHREQILDAAIAEYQEVFEASRDEFGKLAGGSWEADKKFVFATVQTLSRPENLEKLAADHFDLIIIDEVHRAGAPSYQALFDQFTPEFTLGLTATPERTDGYDIFKLFDFNVAYEIRLQRALEEDMLVPFHYFGVTDFVDGDNNTITETTELANLVSTERVDHVLRTIDEYGFTDNVKGLVFCGTINEAKELSALLNQRSINGRKLRTVALVGDSTVTERELAVEKLRRGELDYILTVDIFNEGVNIPEVNQIVMLRNTKSAIIFTQQLGRGLRKAAGKDHVRIIDFIGNYKNNYMIPIALFGDNTRNKDSVRGHIGRGKRIISGLSTVNFDPISKQRIFQSISAATMDSVVEMRKEVRSLQQRLGRLPALYDFAEAGTVDPTALVRRTKTYWSLLSSGDFVDTAPTPEEFQILEFLSTELLPGIRPHELLVLKELFTGKQLSTTEIIKLFDENNAGYSDITVDSVRGILTLSFYVESQRKKFGDIPLVDVADDVWSLNPQLLARYRTSQVPRQLHAGHKVFHATSFADHVDDIIATGLWRCREQGMWNHKMKLNARYSRREVLRMLGWDYDGTSTVYGYKVHELSKTCPIFVTYHKDEEITASTRYEDEFTGLETLHWFTRSRRTLDSKEVQRTIAPDISRHLFVKKDDEEGTDFIYVGVVNPANERNEQMPIDDGKSLNIVSMDLQLESPIEQSLMDYLNTKLPTQNVNKH